LELPGEVRLALDQELSGLRIPGKPVPAESWHITLRFLGSTEQVAYEHLLAALHEAERGPAFRLRLNGLGAFPRPARATVLWIGLEEGGGEVERLADLVEEIAQGIGYQPEERPYHAHLTLSRIRPHQDVRPLLDRYRPARHSWRVSDLVVFRSHLGREGARYEVLEKLPLRR
jgi:2'-5' RNA ligase